MKGRKKMLIAVAIILIIVLSKAFSFTPPIKDGIAEIRRIEINGTKQSLLIRGEDTKNPVLLYLHSGPGTTEMIPFRLAQSGLETHFTVVIWEQRGTGKSFSSNLSNDDMSIDQLMSDAIEVTRYLQKEFGKEKILVVGHSWGTALGLLLVQKYPEYFYAYVGSGQEVCPALGEPLGYQYALNAMQGNDKAITELESLNSPEPYLSMSADDWFTKLITQRKWLVRAGGEFYGQSNNAQFFNAKTILAPEYTWLDYIQFAKGSSFSLKAMWPEVMALDFRQQIPELEVPVFFLQGRNDYNTPASLVAEYFETLSAPSKELIWFESSGHHPMYEEPDLYYQVIIEKVLPLCK